MHDSGDMTQHEVLCKELRKSLAEVLHVNCRHWYEETGCVNCTIQVNEILDIIARSGTCWIPVHALWEAEKADDRSYVLPDHCDIPEHQHSTNEFGVSCRCLCFPENLLE